MNKKALTPLLIGLLTLTSLAGCFALPAAPTAPTAPETPAAPDAEIINYSQEQASDILIDEIIEPDTVDYPLIAFTLDEPLPRGTEVAPYAPDPLPDGVDTLPYLVPTTMTAPTWFFWIDDNPFDQFSHPTRYVFVNAQSGQTTVQEQGWWPYIDGEPVSQWLDDERWDEENQAFTTIPAGEMPSAAAAGEITLASFLGTLPWDRPAPASITDGEAMVHVNGWSQGQTDAGFSGDMTNASTFGTNATIPKHLPNGDTKAHIEDAIKRAVDGGASDVFFYYTGHGGRTDAGRSYMAHRGIAIYPEDLAEIFKKFCNTRFKVVLQGCHLGGFADVLMNSCKVDIFLSACRADETSAADWDPKDADGKDKDVNPNDTGSEYSSGLWEDLEEIRQSEKLQQRARDAIEGKGFDEFVGWLSVANTSAIAKDVDVKLGYTHPVGKMKSRACPDAPCVEEEEPVTIPPLPPVETVMDVWLGYDLTMEIDEDDFSAKVDIEMVAMDLTGGGYPITSVNLKVGDEVWFDSGEISVGSFEDTISGELMPDSFFDVYLTVGNAAGMEMTETAVIEVPGTMELSLPIAMGAQSVSDQTGCRSTLTISYSATLATETDVTVSQVILTVNGETWADSGAIATTDYHNVIERQVACGETFNAVVTATTSDGQTFTTDASLTTPVPD